MTEINKEIKLIIIEQEESAYENSKYQLSLRHRVQKAIGGTPEQLKSIEDEMAKIEQALDELDKIKGELNA